MKTRSVLFVMLLAAVLALAASGAKQPPSPNQTGGNDAIDLKVTVYLDPAEIKQILGIPNPPPDLVLMRVSIRPKGDKPYRIDRDDFTLITHRDGQRSNPFSPEQLASSSALVVRPGGRGMGGGGMGAEDPTGPVWGGIGGRPRQMPGTGISGGGIGDHSVDSKIEGGGKQDNNPVLATLREKVLPDNKEITDKTEGLLYFSFEGKQQKLKDLELLCKTPAGRINIEFK